MWWFFSIQAIVFPILALEHSAVSADLSNIGPQFFLLGLIPGTNFQITFTDIIFCLWLSIFVIFAMNLYLRAQIILAKINLYRYLPLIWQQLLR